MQKVEKLQLIWHILFQRQFGSVSSVHFQALMTKELMLKYYNKQITTRDNGNAQLNDQEESKLNRTIIANNSAHTPTDCKITKVHSIRIK